MLRAFESCLSGSRDSQTPDIGENTIVSLPGHVSGDSCHFKGPKLHMGLEMTGVGHLFVTSQIHRHHMNLLADSDKG